jgi:predicted nucleotide-binding protein
MVLAYKLSEKEESRIQQLEKFRVALRRWGAAYDAEERENLRSFINGLILDVHETVLLAGCLVTVTVTPPPITGGLVFRNLDPFDHIFNPPYDQNLIPAINDMVERATAIIRSGKFQMREESVLGDVTRKHENRQSSTKVFLVHGHDESARETVARFLEKLGLEAVILHEQPSSGKTLIEKIERYSDVAFAVVLLTPDDSGAEQVPNAKLSPRARQNVILELGYFMGKLGRQNVAAILKGEVERPSDYDGVNYTAMDPHGAWRLKLAQELDAAGLKVDLNGLVGRG